MRERERKKNAAAKVAKLVWLGIRESVYYHLIFASLAFFWPLKAGKADTVASLVSCDIFQIGPHYCQNPQISEAPKNVQWSLL